MGLRLPIVAIGGCSPPGLGQPDCQLTHREDEIVRTTVPAEMGDDIFGIYQRNGLYRQPPPRSKEGSSCASASCGPQAERTFSKGKRRRLRARSRAAGVDGGGHLPQCAIYEQEGDVEESQSMWESPLAGSGPHGSRSLLGAVNYTFRSMMASRCAFSFYVRSVLHCSHGPRDAVATALFPIPLPLDGAWVFGLQRYGKDRRLRLARRRLVQLSIMALNYLYFRQPLKTLPGMQRRPGPVHQEIYARLIALSKAGGPSQEVSVLGCGRKSFQFGARFEELFNALQRLRLDSSSPYQHEDEGTAVDVINEEELVPYRPLCAERLKISGSGQWDPTPYLSDLFYLPFVEPRCNEFEIEAPRHLRPDLSAVDIEEVKALCMKWDEKGLLELLPKEVGFPDQNRFVKVFNNYKSALADRQIGDRRSQNFAEGRIPGPSRALPTAAELLQVQPRRFVDALTVSITDRRDFYHQFYVTSERASRNAVYPWFSASDFSNTKAFEVFRSSFCTRRRKQRREEEGDYLLGRGRPRPLLVPEDGETIACFKALFQGDHLGVEIACDSHSALLETHGLLDDKGQTTFRYGH